jgi:hypothetical protein
MVNFYRRFLPGIARTLQSRTEALRGDPKTLEWPPAVAAAFKAAKATLVAVEPLVHPTPNTVLFLATDASDTQVGVMLQQLVGGSWQPLAFYSKKLSGAGTRYSTFDRELLAAFSTVRHFRLLLEGRRFHLLTDHKPLVRHTPGQENVVADALSHLPPAVAQQPPSAQPSSPAPTAEDWPEEGLVTQERPILAAFAEAQPVNFSAMAAAQRSCPEVAEMMNSTTLEITTQAVGDDSLLGDVLTGVFRPPAHPT